MSFAFNPTNHLPLSCTRAHVPARVLIGVESLIDLGSDESSATQDPTAVLQPLTKLNFLHRSTDNLASTAGVTVLLLWNSHLVSFEVEHYY